MPILYRLIVFLIHIDQETILQFFGINYEEYHNYNLVDFDVDVPVSTEVSMETLQILINSFVKHYQYGLGFIDIENIHGLCTKSPSWQLFHPLMHNTCGTG